MPFVSITDKLQESDLPDAGKLAKYITSNWIY